MSHSPKQFFRRPAALIFLGLILAARSAMAADVSYDRYASLYREKPAAPSLLSKVSTDFLTYPFELLRWPATRGAVMFDKYHLWDKGQWLYERSVDLGVTPRFDGADFDFLRMTGVRAQFPDTTIKGWTSYQPNNYFSVGGKVGMERIADTAVRTFTSIHYENRPQQYFYGIGPNTSRGEGTSYRMEGTTVQGEIGYSKDPSMSMDFFTAYKRVNITNGEDGGRGIIDTTFPNQTIPGLDGDEIISSGVKVARDMRNFKENSTKGYLARAEASFNEGLFHSNARYYRYNAEFINYTRLGTNRRVFVSRLYGEHNNEAHGHSVPFHQMARLGGYGMASDLAQTLRGYDRNRFTDESAILLNAEYRYTVYEYRDWKIDTILFFDAGQVFNDFGKFQFQDFRETYGGGFRLSILNNVFLSVELGHGDEGTHFYVKSRSPF